MPRKGTRVLAKIAERRRGRTVRMEKRRARRRPRKLRDNPTLAILGNPPRVLSHNVHYVAYTHRKDGRDYKHEFGTGVTCYLLPNGDVLLRHKHGKPLWQEFPE